MIDAATELHPRPKPPLLLADVDKVEVPERMKRSFMGDAFNSNRLTGIPEKNDGARATLVTRLKQTMEPQNKEEPEGWACLYGDLDQLKVVNDRFGRAAGDAYIKWGVTSALQTLDRDVALSEQAIIIPVRQGTAADEMIVWMFKMTPQEIEQVQKMVDQGKFPTEEIQMSGDSGTFAFSSSYGLVTSEDPQMAEQIKAAKAFLKENPTSVPWDLFNAVEERSSDFARKEKIAKELERLPVDEFLQPNHIEDFIGLITSDFGGGRISPEILEMLLKLQSVKTISSVDPERYQEMLVRLGVQSETIEERVKNAPSAKEKADILVGLFQDLFGKVDD